MKGRNTTPSGLSRREFLAASAATVLTASCSNDPGRGAPAVPDEILAFHRESAVLDLHVDTLLWMRLLGYDIAARHENRLPSAPFGWHMDLPRAREGGLDGAVLGLVINPTEVRPELMRPLRLLAAIESDSGLPQTLATLDLLAATADANPDDLAFCLSGTEMRDAIAAGRFAALAGLEGAHGIEDRIENVTLAYRKGLRMLGLVHFQASAVGYPMTVASFDDLGLTPFGFDVLAEMDELGMVVDLAHLNARGVDDCLGAMTRPFVASHSACAGVNDVPRNLTDDQLRRIADRGGVIGIAVGRFFLGRPGIDGFADHVEHALRVAGPDAVAIGSDWDGAITPAEGMEDVRCLPRVTQTLLSRGQPPDVIRKVLGENALRVLTDVCG